MKTTKTQMKMEKLAWLLKMMLMKNLKGVLLFLYAKYFSFDLGVKYDISMRFTLKRPTKIKKRIWYTRLHLSSLKKRQQKCDQTINTLT